MSKILQNVLNVLITLVIIIAIFTVMSPGADVPAQDNPPQVVDPSLTPSETIPPSTPLATVTPHATLRPPPTFEPPTATPQPSDTPTQTPTQVIQFNSALAGVHGLETPTPTSTPGCVPRRDWHLTYEVQPNDALDRIAQTYSTTRAALAEANCLSDPNLIRVGQQLRVPGDTPPQQEAIPCVPWEVLTPIDGAFDADPNGQLTFNWRGPRAPRNLIRVYKPDGSTWERVIDLRQNETIDLAQELPDDGVYTWYVYPLGMDFLQINCHEGGPWTFHKTQSSER